MRGHGQSRRRFLAGASALAAQAAGLGQARAGEARAGRGGGELRVIDWVFPGKSLFPRRAVVLLPTHLEPGEKAPVLVLLHGLGEAKAGPEVGAFAWLDRYGAGSCYERLRNPPLATVMPRRVGLTAARAAELNESLRARPFRGLCLVCPFTPNVWSYKSTPRALDAFTDFVTGELLDRAASELPGVSAAPADAALDGCSLGGYMALELFQRRPDRFAALGVVQPAIGSRAVGPYAAAIAARKGGPPRVHVESSTADPYRRVSGELSAELVRLGVPCDFIAPPGPHDQPFLREVGSVEMLLWHDRALRPA